MRWAYRLGSYRGIDVFVHVTFLLLLAYLALSNYFETRSLQAAAYGVTFVVAVFGCVVLHEFGHALAAARYGIPTRDIVLYPIGGVARLERMPRLPRRELVVALAGPLVNVAIAIVLYVWLRVAGSFAPLGGLDWGGMPFFERLMIVNIGLVLFNLLPAFPMDGGRVLRALLALRLGHDRATSIAALIGRGLAVVFGIVGFQYSPMLVLIALFIWSAAGQERRQASLHRRSDRASLDRLIETDVRTLEADCSLLDAVQASVAADQPDFPVIEAGRLKGMLWRESLLRGLEELGEQAAVREVTDLACQPARRFEPVEVVLRRLLTSRARLVPVVDELGRVVGVVTATAAQEFLRMRR